jgi:hypothetical protein
LGGKYIIYQEAKDRFWKYFKKIKMSIEQSIYMGPYIVAPTRKIQVSKTKKVCSTDESHKVVLPADFCPQCGSKLIEVVYSAPKYLGAWEELQYGSDDFVDSLAPTGNPEILIPNRGLKGPSGEVWGLYLNCVDTEKFPLPSEATQEENMTIFKNQYAKAIEFLKNQGFEITFNYGLIVSFS